MDVTDLASTTALVVAVPTLLLLTVAGTRLDPPWWAPLLLAVPFLAWSGYAIAQDGLFGFWAEHVGTPWESQIWMDLLLAAGTAWVALQPRLRAVGLRPLPWLALVLATGSLGLLALLTRLAWAERRMLDSTPQPAARA